MKIKELINYMTLDKNKIHIHYTWGASKVIRTVNTKRPFSIDAEYRKAKKFAKRIENIRLELGD